MLLAAFPALGAVSSPLGGYCRQGKYTPLQTESGIGEFRYTLPGAVPVVANQLKAGAVVPLLFIENPRRPVGGNPSERNKSSDWDFKPLEADQRLVGFVGQPDSVVAEDLFPVNQAIGIHVDLPQGPAIAYNTLDALVFDNPLPSVDRMVEFWISGITVGVKTREKPAGNLPWEQTPWGWKLPSRWAGPNSAGENPIAMKCVEGWVAQYPKSHRTRIGLLGVVTALAFIGGAMAPRKWRTIGVMGLGVILSVGWIVWGRGVERVVVQTAQIRTDRGQNDRLRFYAAVKQADISIDWEENMLPMGACEGLTLQCDEKGSPVGWKVSLKPLQKLGMVCRSFKTDNVPTAGEKIPAFSKISKLVSQSYLSGGLKIKSFVSGQDDSDWGMVFLGEEE